MKADAIAKIKAEIDRNKSNPYIKVVGDFLLGHLETDPEAAEKIMAADKTIAKSLDAMKAEAKKKQQNGMAMLTDAEGFAIVLKYFGIKGKPVVSSSPVAPPSDRAALAPAAKPAVPDFDVKLDDFL
ncbi:Cas9 inhibitor AcrIIA9 family protein [Brevibacillus borstelensis]|uniref:Cas9 inhibitor AcrIIA9 family protein n=1 Tax=Brevibacillus borstelensis TaxID=45462 RepID=UPI0004F35255|nr:Cas9 inhibitor AcrIIA9 family protein [Brevibacillus borstelensis]KKX56360.1 hypothetical protein X546_04560 [Brevibacillus borstelensis cifa_chp40]